MKCALELIGMNLEAAAELEKERQRKLEQEERERREWLEKRRQQVYEATIKFCENEIGPALEEAAKKGKDTIEASFPITTEPNGEFCLLYKHISNAGNIYYIKDGYLDWNVCRTYLAQFCIDIKAVSGSYPCCNLNDYIRGATLIVSINKLDCI